MGNKKRMRAFVVGVGIFALAGCSMPNSAGTNKEGETQDIYIEDNVADTGKKDTPDGNGAQDTPDRDNAQDTPNGNDARDASDGNGAQDTPDRNNAQDTPNGNDTRDASDGNGAQDTPDGDNANAAGSMDGGEMIAACDLQGSVTEFSDNGCTINPVTSDHDSEAVIAAEGYEDESAKVTVKYGDGCTFQRAVISIATGKAVASEAAKAEIKKKTSLLLYGNFDDTENFTAAKVVIVQYE